MLQSVPKCSIGSSHGKLILVGEHSVVYGMPAIAIPFPLLEAVAVVENNLEQMMISCDYYIGPLTEVPKKMKGIEACINETLKFLNKQHECLFIRIHSSIPIGRGLGSSAAIAIAIVKSLFDFYKQSLHPNELMSFVHIAETFAHGNPSGIDMVAASSEFPIWFQKGNKIETLRINGPLCLVVADTGEFADTHITVERVKHEIQSNPVQTQHSLNQLGMITLEARTALSHGDMKYLGRLLDKAQDELVAIGVSDDRINRLVAAARYSGALGAKLTGGGQGGCILALAPNYAKAKVIADKLMKAGATNSWYFTLECKG
jgi:mevalonate kinase